VLAKPGTTIMSRPLCNPNYEDATWAFYRFVPSVEANAVFVALFGISTLLHTFQMWRTKTWYLWALIVGGACTSTTLSSFFRDLFGDNCLLMSAFEHR
jgi:hypothetical protein